MKKLLLVALLAAAVWFFWNRFQQEENPPGAFLTTEPRQEFVLALPFKRDGFTVYPVARFQVDARVFGRMAYNDGDFESRLAPVDLALGWGPLVDDHVAAQIAVTQAGRFYHWRCENRPLPVEKISRSSANMHIIPGSPEVTHFLSTVSPGQKISLKGKLVYVAGPDQWQWQSSLSREDTGDGACEVFYVESATSLSEQKTEILPETASAAKPARQVANRQQPQIPADKPDVQMTKTKTFPIPYGSLTVPAGDVVRIAAEKGSKVKAVYRGVEFWVERKELE